MRKRASDYSRLAAELFVPGIRRRRAEWVPDVTKNLETIHKTIAEEYDRTVDGVLTDPDLAFSGRAKALRRAKLTHTEKLDAMDRDLVGALRARVANLEAQVAPKIAFPRPTDPAERLAYELEKDRFLKSMDGLDSVQRLNAYYTITDPKLRDFMETAGPVVEKLGKNAGALAGQPTLKPFVDEETLSMARAAKIRAVEPALADEIEDVSALAQVYKTVIDSVRSMVLEDMPEVTPEAKPHPQPTGDPVADAGMIPTE